MGNTFRVINYDGDIEISIYIKANAIFKTNEYSETEDVCIYKETINIFNLLKENQELKQKYLNAVADYETTRAEKEQLKEKFKATNKGLQKVVLKRKKWKYRYQLARCEIKELKEKLDKYENPEDMTLMMMWCTEKVKDENQALNKQLEDKEDYINKLQATKDKLDKWDYGNTMQQKEFIKYLEDEIQNKREKSTTLTAFIRNVVPLQQCLQKYKSIIGGKDEKDNN